MCFQRRSRGQLHHVLSQRESCSILVAIRGGMYGWIETVSCVYLKEVLGVTMSALPLHLAPSIVALLLCDACLYHGI
jgi:hypothetical protein